MPFAIFLVLTNLICGALVMVIEVLGSRVIGPFFGVNLFVWTSLITVTLAGLAAGYAVGGLLADYRGSPPLLYAIILLAGVTVLLIPVLRKPVLEATLSLGLRLGSLSAACLLFGPSLFILGCVFPYVVKIAVEGTSNIGWTVGSLYAVSTLGSLLGTVCTGFFLISYFPVDQIFTLCGGVLIFVSALFFLLFKRTPGYLVLLALPFLLPISNPVITKHLDNGTVVERIYAADTFYGSLKVLDRHSDKHIREMVIDGVVQGGIDVDNGLPVYDYYYYLEYIPFCMNPEGKRCLVIGLGAGIVPLWYESKGVRTDVVDINAEVFRVAEKYFGFHSRGDKIIADARYFLNCTQEKYDYIIFDVFNAENTPEHMLNRESLQLLALHLNPGGILAMNLVNSVTDDTFVMSSMIKTLREVFTTVEIFPTFSPLESYPGIGNFEIIAGNSHPPIPEKEWLRAFPFHPLAASAREKIGERFTLPENQAGIVLTDNYNPIELYDLPVKEEFRKRLLKGSIMDLLL